MSTYLDLIEKVSRTLQDEENDVFTVTVVKDMIAAGFAAISAIAPQRFTEDITPVADQTSYTLRSDDFADEPQDEIELISVEVWDNSGDTAYAWRHVDPMSKHPMGLTYSQAGWMVWDGVLHLPDRVVDMIDPDVHFIRVRGYSPFPLPVADDDVLPFTPQREEALVVYCYAESLRRLIANRVLFKQWQTRSNNTDVTPAALMNDLNLVMEDWRRRARAITVIREAP